MYIGTKRWPDVSKQLTEYKMAILPCGSFEQHSKHLPMDSDTATAFAVAKAVGEKSGVPVFPPVSIGMSTHHFEFPGSISFRADTYKNVIRDIVSSLCNNDVERILLINGHGGNNRVLQETLRELSEEYKGSRLFAMVHCMGLLGELMPELKSRKLGHSDFREISVMLHLRPEDVDLDNVDIIEKPDYRPTADIIMATHEQAEYKNVRVFMPQPLKKVAPTGGWGEAGDASSNDGEQYIEVLSDYISSFIEAFLKIPVDTGK